MAASTSSQPKVTKAAAAPRPRDRDRGGDGEPEPEAAPEPVLAPEEEELVAMEVGSPPLPKKSAPAGQLDQPPARIGTKLSPEPPGSKPEPQDSKSEYFAWLLVVSDS